MAESYKKLLKCLDDYVFASSTVKKMVDAGKSIKWKDFERLQDAWVKLSHTFNVLRREQVNCQLVQFSDQWFESMQEAFWDLLKRSDELLDMEEITEEEPTEENDEEVSEMDEYLEEVSKNEAAMVDAKTSEVTVAKPPAEPVKADVVAVPKRGQELCDAAVFVEAEVIKKSKARLPRQGKPTKAIAKVEQVGPTTCGYLLELDRMFYKPFMPPKRYNMMSMLCKRKRLFLRLSMVRYVPGGGGLSANEQGPSEDGVHPGDPGGGDGDYGGLVCSQTFLCVWSVTARFGATTLAAVMLGSPLVPPGLVRRMWLELNGFML